jgi:hypothetical protein
MQGTQNPAHFTGRVGSSPTSGTNLPLPKLGFKLFSLRLSLRLCGESHASNFQHALNRTKNT